MTFPVGVPAPGGAASTVKVTVTFCPTAEESGLSDVMVVVASALLTVCGTPADGPLPLKFVSPLYVAVSVFAPTDVLGRLQLVAGNVMVQLLVPSVTVIVPVGVPLPGEVTVTDAVTA